MISKYNYLQYFYFHKGYVTVSEQRGGFKKMGLLHCPGHTAKIPINKKKMEDVRKIIQYIPVGKKEFNENIFIYKIFLGKI